VGYRSQLANTYNCFAIILTTVPNFDFTDL